MKQKSNLVILAVLVLILGAPSAAAAQPGSSHPFVLYSDEGGSSYLGVQTEDITAERMNQLHLKEEQGVEVTTVDQDAPASKAGLKEHDVILSVNDQKIESVEQLKRVIRETPPGRTVSIGISRDGQPITVKAQLAERDKFAYNDHAFNFVVPPINVPAIHIPPFNMPEMDFGPVVVIHSLGRSGLMVENLTPQLGEFFGVKNGTGVLVRSVEKGSRGEQAGFRAGDVVVKIDGSQVNDCSDFTRLLRKRTNNKASVTVMRDRKEQTLTLTLPEPRRSGSLYKSETCDSEDWADCAAELKTELAQLVPEMTTAELREIGPDMQREMHDLQPEMEKMRKDMEKMRPELEKIKKELCTQSLHRQKAFKQQMESTEKQLQQQKKELEKELEKEMKEWKKAAEI
jgi:serine protease Do